MYTAKVTRFQVKEDQRFPVPQLDLQDSSFQANMWVTEAPSSPHRRGKLYEICLDFPLPETRKIVTVRLGGDTVKSRALTTAAVFLSLPRPVLLDLARSCMSDWSKHQNGVESGPDSGRWDWEHSDGVPFRV